MTEKLELNETDKELDIGTASGFQAAVLAQLPKTVYTIQIYEGLTSKVKQVLDKLGCQNIKYKIGDGKLGWQEFAPFYKIVITVVAKEIPPLLLEQLKVGGKMVLPLEL